jgi:hypothetical protein
MFEFKRLAFKAVDRCEGAFIYDATACLGNINKNKADFVISSAYYSVCKQIQV